MKPNHRLGSLLTECGFSIYYLSLTPCATQKYLSSPWVWTWSCNCWPAFSTPANTITTVTNRNWELVLLRTVLLARWRRVTNRWTWVCSTAVCGHCVYVCRNRRRSVSGPRARQEGWPIFPHSAAPTLLRLVFWYWHLKYKTFNSNLISHLSYWQSK